MSTCYLCHFLIACSWPGIVFAQLADGNASSTNANSFTNSVGMKLVLIPAGEFTMGSPEEEAHRWDIEHQHAVKISQPYYMGVHEVTQAQFEEVMGFNPSRFSRTGNRSEVVEGIDTADFPVEWVSFADAMEFCMRLSCLQDEMSAGRVYRLPTEAEWERACRGGIDGQVFGFGNTLSSKEANIRGRSPYGPVEAGPDLQRPVPVGSYASNAFGLFDMHGNVAEWCLDRYDRDYYLRSPAVDPVGRQHGSDACRVIRGGAWSLGGVSARSAQRAPRPTLDRPQHVWLEDSLGFRVVCVASESDAEPSSTDYSG